MFLYTTIVFLCTTVCTQVENKLILQDSPRIFERKHTHKKSRNSCIVVLCVLHTTCETQNAMHLMLYVLTWRICGVCVLCHVFLFLKMNYRCKMPRETFLHAFPFLPLSGSLSNFNPALLRIAKVMRLLRLVRGLKLVKVMFQRLTI